MVVLLCVTVIAPVLLYTDRFATFNPSSSKQEFIEDVTSFAFNGHSPRLNLLPQETSTSIKEPIGVIYSENSSNVKDLSLDLQSPESMEHKSTRVLSATSEDDQSHKENNPIRQVTDGFAGGNQQKDNGVVKNEDGKQMASEQKSNGVTSLKMEKKYEKQSAQTSGSIDVKGSVKPGTNKQTHQTASPAIPMDVMVRQLKDQLVRARVISSLTAVKNNPPYTRELRLRIKEVQRILGDANKDSELPKNANEKLKLMEQTLTKGKQIQDDCATVVKKLRAMLHMTEEQLRVHKKQTMFLTQLTAKTLPKGLHCLPLRLTSEYYTLNYSQRQFPNQDKLEDPRLYHYTLFSDNILAAAVVVNSTITNAKDPAKHVFHVVTDKLNYAAMRMWFLINPPGNGTIEVQNVEDLTWLNASYSPVLKQLGSQSMIDYYFRAHQANSDSNLKYRNPKYLSILNHLRFYLPEIFPKLNKVLFVDDDIVVQKDLSGLWSVDLKGKVNGAVETCGESFHRFDRYLNFSNPLIAKNFNPHACGWAYGMNVFDLEEWKKQNITEVYHRWQKLNHDRQLWKLGTLPPGLITFSRRTYPLDRSWHVLGLGYNAGVHQRDIEHAAVVHYNGNMKPWLEIGIPKFRNYWSKYVDYEHVYLRECNINP
jgi:alpha-1,4-galacturonosyltransferase